MFKGVTRELGRANSLLVFKKVQEYRPIGKTPGCHRDTLESGGMSYRSRTQIKSSVQGIVEIVTSEVSEMGYWQS
ncbi:MAG: hypothetical protein GWN67_13540 [Phycisphaerae bacterium]|nr:hypothetical protein [Phycisphaerae bacterium]NIU57365.1 hypothetical protein [Phycisphaerae bacterium]NIX01677.1 hypothetical protein [Phycisphaerae bacterium]